MKNDICVTKHQVTPKAGRPRKPQIATVGWRPKSKKARDKFYELGGSRWLDRVLEGLVK